ncbi:hypothetical protein Hdeb2414_s0001g00028121 [Helianthus debilis subsp. tardiflorus]
MLKINLDPLNSYFFFNCCYCGSSGRFCVVVLSTGGYLFLPMFTAVSCSQRFHMHSLIESYGYLILRAVFALSKPRTHVYNP